jgi:hypothetical protein
MVFYILMLLHITNSCEKESYSKFIGTWVSTDRADTLFFINNSIFNKSFSDGIKHIFEYSYCKDSIIIQYKGPNKILVMPSAHYYDLDNRKLTIDFTNGCYGFKREKETFLRL